MFIMLGSLVAPSLGLLLSLLMPAPLVLLYLQHGKSAGMFALGAVLVVLSLTAGLDAAMGFAVAYAILVVFLAEGIRFNLPPDKTIAVAALSAALLSGILIWMTLTGEGHSPVEFLQSQLKVIAEDSLKAFKESGASAEEIALMKEATQYYVSAISRAPVAILVVGAMLTATLNYLLVRSLWLKFYPANYFQDSEPSNWILPDQIVWGFILSFGTLFLGDGAIKWVGLNVFIIVLTLYYFQGLAITLAILKAKNAHVIVSGVVFLLVLTQPPMMGLAIGLGLFDTWVDFRKIRKPVIPAQEEPEDFED